MNIAAWQRLCSVRTPWRGHTSIPVLPNVAAHRQAVTMFLHSMCQCNLYYILFKVFRKSVPCIWSGLIWALLWVRHRRVGRLKVHSETLSSLSKRAQRLWTYHSFVFSYMRKYCGCEEIWILRVWQIYVFWALLIVKCGFWNGICSRPYRFTPGKESPVPIL
jgi:hypothetical protein